MSTIAVDNKVFHGLKSDYLNNVLRLRDQRGKAFPRIIRRAAVKTSCGHTLWFTEVNGNWNRFFRRDGIDYIRENNLTGRWQDTVDQAAERFSAGELPVRSVICRWTDNDGNRYFGEYQLVEANDAFRIWKRIAASVEMDVVA